jgi:hypothetical protein
MYKIRINSLMDEFLYETMALWNKDYTPEEILHRIEKKKDADIRGKMRTYYNYHLNKER